MGDMSQVLPSPVLSSVPNGFSNHTSPRLGDPMEEDNPSLHLINEIASSLSNQDLIIPRAPPLPPPKPTTTSYQSSSYRPAPLSSTTSSSAFSPVSTGVSSTPLSSARSVFSPGSESDTGSSFSYPDTGSGLNHSSPSRSSFKRVSKLNKNHPVISCMLEENAGFESCLAEFERTSSSSKLFTDPPSATPPATTTQPESQTSDYPQPMDYSSAVQTPSRSTSDTSYRDCDKSFDSENQSPSITYSPQISVDETFSSDNTLQESLEQTTASEKSASEPCSAIPSGLNDTSGQLSNGCLSSDCADTSSNPCNMSSANNLSVHRASNASHSSNTSLRNVEEEEGDSSILLLERRPFRPFKNPEDYLYAMREDLAEWLNCLYELNINADNFFEVLETGEVLCQHANAVRAAAEEAGRNGRRLSGRWSVPQNEVVWRPGVEPGSFRARDNVSNFIKWIRNLGVHEVLLFETDDLVLRKNEKHVVLALLEVARQGHKLGMAAPLLVQMEDDIDRHERLLEERRLQQSMVLQESINDEHFQEVLTAPEVVEEPPQIYYGPTKQIVTNDLRSLDEMVRDLVERCACPSQFPMVKVSDGKYRIGDTRVLIFVRILRNHVMVRVGGGWDTLEHYLDKHDPCRCRAGHRVALSSHVGFKNPGNADTRQLSSVTYDRCEDGSLASPSAIRRRSSGPPRRESGPAAAAGGAGSLRQRSQSPANVTSRLHAGRSALATPSNTTAHHPLAASSSGGGPPTLDEVTGRSPEPPGWCDSSSEVSDEGYRSQGAPPRPSPRTRRHQPRKLSIGDASNLSERPESSMTHTSSEGSTVSTDDLGVPPTPPRSPPAGDSSHCLPDHPLAGGHGSRTHIPQPSSRSKLNSTDSLNKTMGQKKKKTVAEVNQRPAWNSGLATKKEEAKRRGSCADLSAGYPISRSRSTNSDSGFHSLTRNSAVRKSLSASRPSQSGTRLNDSSNTGGGSYGLKGTWSGRGSRGRPPVNTDVYKPPAPPRGVRSASASPGPIRRNFGHSAPVTPQTRSPKQSAPNSTLASPTHTPNKLPDFIVKKVPDLGDINSKPSVEMLEQLEELVNSYRVRVLDHFAEEGKAPPPELTDDFSCSWVRDTQSLTNSPKKVVRGAAPPEKPAVKLTPRRDGLGSRIPAPTFYHSRNTPS